VSEFASGILTTYLNYHRPPNRVQGKLCFFPTEYTGDKGRLRKTYRYPDMMTPYEKPKSTPKAQRFLKPGAAFEQLDAIAQEYSDNEAVRRLNQARATLFQHIDNSQPSPCGMGWAA
jgi:hypothetical protein